MNTFNTRSKNTNKNVYVLFIICIATAIMFTTNKVFAKDDINISWNIPGTYTWTVPNNISKVFIFIKGGDSGNGGIGNCSLYSIFSKYKNNNYFELSSLGEDGESGEKSSFGKYIAKGGKIIKRRFSCKGGNKSIIGEHKFKMIDVTPGSVVKVSVGRGGKGGRVFGRGGSIGENGENGYVQISTDNYFQQTKRFNNDIIGRIKGSKNYIFEKIKFKDNVINKLEVSIKGHVEQYLELDNIDHNYKFYVNDSVIASQTCKQKKCTVNISIILNDISDITVVKIIQESKDGGFVGFHGSIVVKQFVKQFSETKS